MKHAFTPEEYELFRSCVQADPVRQNLGIHSRLGTLAVLKDCIFYMDKDDSMCRMMTSVADKLIDMSDAEFLRATLLNGC